MILVDEYSLLVPIRKFGGTAIGRGPGESLVGHHRQCIARMQTETARLIKRILFIVIRKERFFPIIISAVVVCAASRSARRRPECLIQAQFSALITRHAVQTEHASTHVPPLHITTTSGCSCGTFATCTLANGSSCAHALHDAIQVAPARRISTSNTFPPRWKLDFEEHHLVTAEHTTPLTHVRSPTTTTFFLSDASLPECL